MRGAKGRIVNISSVGGKMGPPFLGTYAAAKHGVEGFTESARRELQRGADGSRWAKERQEK